MILSHITLNTGHVRESPQSEVDEVVVQRLRKWIAVALAAGATIPLPAEDLAHFSAVALQSAGALVVTVYGPAGPHSPGRPVKGEGIPLVTFGCATAETLDVWTQLVSSCTGAADVAEPVAPWCAVILHPSMALYPQSLEWLGDFERCVSWAWITAAEAAKGGGK